MNVQLISYTQPITPNFVASKTSLIDQVAYCARISNPTNQANTETNEKLIRYLLKNKHFSPFEMANICLQIDTTRDIARQILRHRSFSFQEFSQRYADASQLGFEVRKARLQDTKNRQNSLEMAEDNQLAREWEEEQELLLDQIRSVYEWALQNGIAKEQARAVLPEGMTRSRMYMNGTLRSWWHYIELRSGNGTQKEHREIALACADAIKEVFPLIEEAITK